MKTDCERPYRNMITSAGAARHMHLEAPAWHVRQLATELANAVFDLDARMRAGLTPPRAWTPTAPYGDQRKTPRSESSDNADGK
ncbi:hypothetical protein [Haloechinothrix salitolerans]|uniref:Uncharacterized protein n=1 Tax=Haloechinothrix salitolerans TaxID=926830 RepID=A0ABW2BWM0_9PSEU